MASSSIYPDNDSDDTGESMAFYNDGGATDDDNEQLDSSDTDSGHALPVVLDDDEGEEIVSRNAIDLDEVGTADIDLSALIGQFEAATQRSRHRKPRAQPTSPPRPAIEPAAVPVYDLASTSAEPVRSDADAAEIASLREQLEGERNKVRRGMADLVNYRRKAEHDRERAIRDTQERVLKQILPIVDDFERSFSAATETRNFDQLHDGIDAILRNFAAMLDKNGIASIETVGQMFDPDFHEAIAADETSELPEDTIVEELRKGYLIDGRLLRAAVVKVARKPVEPETEDETGPSEQAPATGEVGGGIDMDAASSGEMDSEGVETPAVSVEPDADVGENKAADG
jgi:molecular chaperone GrpE